MHDIEKNFYSLSCDLKLAIGVSNKDVEVDTGCVARATRLELHGAYIVCILKTDQEKLKAETMFSGAV